LHFITNIVNIILSVLKDVLILWGVTTFLSAVVYFGILFLVKTFFHPPSPLQRGTKNRIPLSPFGGGRGEEKHANAKTAILTTTILIFILFYFHFYLNVLKINSLQFLRSHRYFLLLIMVLIGVCAFYLFKSKKTFTILNQ